MPSSPALLPATTPSLPQAHQEQLAQERQAHAEEVALLRQERDAALEVGAHRCLAGQIKQPAIQP